MDVQADLYFSCACTTEQVGPFLLGTIDFAEMQEEYTEISSPMANVIVP